VSDPEGRIPTDATDGSAGGPQAEVDQESAETKRLAEEPAGGVDGPIGFATDDPAPAP
jgi:hypothetical protein